MLLKTILPTLLGVVWALGCEPGADTPSREPEAPEAPQVEQVDQPLEVLNLLEEPGRVVFYDKRTVIDEIREGLPIAADDPREIWRFSVPEAMAEGTLDLADPSVEVTVHLRDPACPPRDACAMVTYTLAGGTGILGEGTVQVSQNEPELRFLAFSAEADFQAFTGFQASVSYRGGAFEP